MARFAGEKLTCIRGERLVFRDLGFALESGGALLLTGQNGSGKSSLLRLLAGLLPAASGGLTWEGRPVEAAEDHRARVHYVGHADAVKPMLTVAENLAFWASLRTDARSLGEWVERALDAFAIGALADVPGRFLSAGQKRRVNLARIAAAPAELWLLDEPTTALDSDSVRRLAASIAGHRAQGGMAVLSTHTELDLPGASRLDVGDFSPRLRPPAES